LRHYEDKLATSSRNSSLSPSSDSPAAREERKKLKSLVVAGKYHEHPRDIRLRDVRLK
jgi:pantothenate synthetase